MNKMNCRTLLPVVTKYVILLLVVTSSAEDGEFKCDFDICDKGQYCNFADESPRCGYCNDISTPSICSLPKNVEECKKRCKQNTSPSTTAPPTTAPPTTAPSTTASSSTVPHDTTIPATTQRPSNNQTEGISDGDKIIIGILVLVLIVISGCAFGVVMYLMKTKKMCFANNKIKARNPNQVHDNYNPERAVLIAENNEAASNPTGVPPTPSTDDDKHRHEKFFEDPSVMSLHTNGRKLNNFNINDQTSVKYVNEQQ